MKLFRTSRKRPDTTVRRATCLGIEYLEDRTTPAVSWLGGTGLWRDANQWSSGSVPTAADDVSIAGSGSLVTLTGSAAGKVLDLGGSGASPILALGGSSLGIASATIESGANLFLDGGTLGARGPLAFTAPVATAISGMDDFLAVDLNGDGKSDLAWADRANGLIHFLFSNGDGTFTEGGLEPPFAPTHIALGDVTGDGRPDLVAVGDGPLGSTLMGVFVGDGSSGFTGGFAVPPVDVPVSALGATGVAVGDFTGDGKADIALGIGVASQVILLTNTSIGGTLSFGQSNVSAGGPSLKSLIAADIDSDGKLDLIGAGSGDRMVVMRQSGGGAFDVSDYGAAPGVKRVAATDLNGDGRLDLIAISDGGTAANPVSVAGIFPNAGGGAFGARIDLDLGANLFADHLAVGDWNGDGRPDVAVNTTAGLALIENLGGGAYPVTILGTGAQFAIVGGDVNGDGKDDLVSVAGSAGNLSAEVWTNVHARGLVENQGRLFGPGVIAGNFTQAAGGVLELTAFSATVYDALTVEGSATLGGTLRVTLGYVPTAGTSFTLLSAGTIAGTFSTVSVVNLPSGLTATTTYINGGVAIAFDSYTAGDASELINAFSGGYSNVRMELPDLATRVNGNGVLLPTQLLPAAFTSELATALTNLLPSINFANAGGTTTGLQRVLEGARFTSVMVAADGTSAVGTITVALTNLHDSANGYSLSFLSGIPGQLAWDTTGATLTLTMGVDAAGFYVSTAQGLSVPVALSFAATPIDLVGNHLHLDSASGKFTPTFSVTLADAGGGYARPGTDLADGSQVATSGDPLTSLDLSVAATLTVPGLKFTSPPTTENSDADENAKIKVSGHIGKASGWGISFTASDHIFTLDKFQVSKLSFDISGTFTTAADIKVTAAGEIKVNPDGATNGDITLGLSGSIGKDGFSIAGSITVTDRTFTLGGLGLNLKNTTLAATFALNWGDLHADASIKLDSESSALSYTKANGDTTEIASATGVHGSLNSTGQFSFTADSATLHVGNLLSFSVAGLAIQAGPNLPANAQVFHLDSATASLDFLNEALGGGGAPTATLTDLTFRAGGAFSLGGASISLPAGYTSRLGIAEFLPFELDSLALTFPTVGSFDAFGVTVTGQFNIAEMTTTFGFTPIISVGSDTKNGKFTATVNVASVKQGKIQLQDFGPIRLGFSGLHIGVVTLGGALTLGGIQNGVLVTTASLDATISSTEALGFSSENGGVSLDSFALHADGSYVRDDVAGTISIGLDASVQFGLHAKLAKVFELDNVGFKAHLSLTTPTATFSPTFKLGLDGINVGHVSVGFGDYVQLSANNVVFNFSKEPGTPLATIGTASLSFGLPSDPSDSLGPLGITGSISNLEITQKGLPRLNGLSVSLSLPTGGFGGAFDWFPVRVDKLGLKIGKMFQEDIYGNLIGLDKPADLANFSVIFSGGFDGSKLAPEGGQSLLPLVATIQDVGLSVEKLSKGEFPIENLGGVSFGVLPFDIGPVRIGGLFSFGSVLNEVGKTVYFGRLVGEFDYEGLGAGIDVVISSRGPVIATLSIPLGIPLDPFGITLLSGATGSLTFGVTTIVVPSQPEDIANLTAPTSTITDAVIKTALAGLKDGQYTWGQSIAIALKGTVITPYAPGVVSGDLTIGAYLGTQFTTSAGGLKFFAVGNLRVLGLSFASVKLLADFHSILEPVLAGLIQVPDPSNPLGFLFPAKATAGAFASFNGVVPSYLAAVGAFVDTVAHGTASLADTFFKDSLNLVVTRLRQDFNRPLSKLIFDTNGDGTLSAAERAAPVSFTTAQLRTFFLDRVVALLPSAQALVNNRSSDAELTKGLKLATALVGEVLYTAGQVLEGQGIQYLGDLRSLNVSFSKSVTDLFTSDSQRAMLAFSKVLQDAANSAAHVLVQQLLTKFDPKFLIRAKIQPVIFGLPIGKPPLAGEITLDKRSLGVGVEMHVPVRDFVELPLLPVFGPSILAPLPIPELTFDGTFSLNYPYGDVIADFLINGIPPIDPNAGKWSAKLEGGLSFGPLTLTRTGALMFPADWDFLNANVQKLFGMGADDSVLADRVQVGSQAHYDALQAYGGFLAYSELTLPEFITDPVAAFSGVGAPPKKATEILPWLSSIRGALQFEKEVGRAQLFLPSLSSVLQFNLVDFGKLGALDPGGLLPKIGLRDGKTPTDASDILKKGYLEGVLNGKLLGIEFANARMEADLTHLLIRGNISWLGNASVLFSLGSRQQDVVGTPVVTLKVPTVEAGLDLDTTANLRPALLAWGINPDVFLPTATATFRAYSPAFDTSSTEVLKRTGGLQLETHLRLPGLVEDAAFKFDLTPPTAGKIIPQFTATATVDQFEGLFSIAGGLKIDSAILSLSNADGTVKLTVDGIGTLLGHTVTVHGILHGDLTGSLTVTLTGTTSLGLGLINDGFSLSGSFTLFFTRQGGTGPLQGRIDFNASLSVPKWFGAGGYDVTGSLGTDGSMNLAVNLPNGYTIGATGAQIQLVQQGTTPLVRLMRTAGGALTEEVNGQLNLNFGRQTGIPLLGISGSITSAGSGSLNITFGSLNLGGFTVLGRATLAFNHTANGTGSTYSIAVAGTLSIPGLISNASVSGVMDQNGIQLLTVSAPSAGLALGPVVLLKTNLTLTLKKVAGVYNFHVEAKSSLQGVFTIASTAFLTGDFDKNGFGSVAFGTTNVTFLGLLTVKDAHFAVGRDANGFYLTTGGNVTFLGDTYVLAGRFKLLTGTGTANPLLALEGSVSFTRITSPASAAALVWGGWGISGTTTLSILNGVATVSLTNGSLTIPFVPQTATVNGNLTLGGGGQLTVSLGGGLHFGGLDLNGTFALVADTTTGKPVVSLSATGAQLVWRGTPLVSVPTFAMDGAGNFDVAVVGGTVRIGPATGPAASFTFPSGRLVSNISKKTFALSLSPPTLTFPVGNRTVTATFGVPIDVALGSGNFRAALPPANLNVGDLIKLSGQLVLSRQDGVFHIRLEGIGGQTPTLSLFNLVTATVSNFEIGTDGKFSLNANLPRIGPSFLGIENASLDLSVTPNEGVKLSLSGGQLVLPTGDRQSIGTLNFAGDGESYSGVVHLAQLNLGAGVMIGAADFNLKVTPGLLAVSLKSPTQVTVANSRLTLRSLNVGTNGNFNGTADGTLNLGNLNIGSGSFAIGYSNGQATFDGTVTLHLINNTITLSGRVNADGSYAFSGTTTVRLFKKDNGVFQASLTMSVSLPKKVNGTFQFSGTLTGSVTVLSVVHDLKGFAFNSDGTVTIGTVTFQL